MEKFKRSLFASLLVLALCPFFADAHPMGNFSINHYSKLRVTHRDILVDYVLDFAEIPTFQMFPEARAGSLDARADRLASAWLQNLRLTANGVALPMEVTTSNFQVRPGAGGLATVRAVFHLRASWAGGAARLHLSDANFKERIGWKEIVVQAEQPFGFPKGNPFSEDRSAGLSTYPADPASSAPDVTEVSIDVAAAQGAFVSGSASPSGPPAKAEAGEAVADRLSAILGNDVLPARTVILGMLIAFALGALHALSPGHGKTVVASFLVGARGTARHALFLGAVVTFTHTIGVFLLGLAVLFLSDYIVPERLYPWIGFLSGAMILAVGVSLFRQRFGRISHDHGPHGHTHEVAGEVTLRNLFALGFSGGIVPCPSALVVLLSAIAVHRVGAGLLFIVAFSFGLASVLVTIGILVVRASRLLARFDRDHGGLRFVPVVSAAIISVIGLGMAVQALAGVHLESSALILSSQMLAVLGLGLLLGLKHATDADHVVAVTTFVSQESSLLRSCWIGAFWGVGHTLSLSIAGLIVIGLKVTIPEWLSERLELGVAVMLVVLGANALFRTAKPSSTFRPSHSHAGLRPLLTGMVHGAAGSAALMLLVLSTIRSPLEAFLYILIFGLGSILGMLAISFLLALPLHWARGKVGFGCKPIQVMAGLFSCVFGLYLGAEIWMSLQ